MSFLLPNPRRLFLGQSGLLLSGAAVALLAGKDALAAQKGKRRPAPISPSSTRRWAPNSKPSPLISWAPRAAC